MSEWMAKQLEAAEARANDAEGALAAERKRREEAEQDASANEHEMESLRASLTQAERERDASKRHYDAAGPEHNLLALLDLYHDRKMEAERERDDLRKEHDEDQGVIRVWRGWCERADADNAALLKALDRAKVGLARVLRFGTGTSDETQPERNTFGEEVANIDAALYGIHPGAAMLERMRALKEEKDSVVRWIGVVRDELVNAGGKPGDREVALENLRAVLERMRALEDVADRMAALAMHDEACQSDVGGISDPANCALCEYNALKPETK